MLEKMLCSDRAGQLAKDQHINGYDLFPDMLNYICSPVTDGWSTFEIILEESAEELDLLRLMTKVVYPESEDYFVGQIGQHFQCEKDFEFQIDLKFQFAELAKYRKLYSNNQQAGSLITRLPAFFYACKCHFSRGVQMNPL